jgi:hypothetical protein
MRQEKQHINDNPFEPTAEYWDQKYREYMCQAKGMEAYGAFMRSKYWGRRAKLWDYLEAICIAKEIDNG